MEVERDVEIQVVESEADPKGKLNAGFSSGPRAGGALPDYTDKELEEALGPLAARIRATFAPLSRIQQKAAAETSRSTLASTLPQKRDGW
jgi:hypothetical protein